jgi:YggT family protein
MGILSNTVYVFVRILTVLILVRMLSSWFRPRYRTSGNSWFFAIDEMVWRATEPLLAPIRNILPTGGMGLDFSPMILLFILQLVGNWIMNALRASGL